MRGMLSGDQRRRVRVYIVAGMVRRVGVYRFSEIRGLRSTMDGVNGRRWIRKFGSRVMRVTVMLSESRSGVGIGPVAFGEMQIEAVSAKDTLTIGTEIGVAGTKLLGAADARNIGHQGADRTGMGAGVRLCSGSGRGKVGGGNVGRSGRGKGKDEHGRKIHEQCRESVYRERTATATWAGSSGSAGKPQVRYAWLRGLVRCIQDVD